MQKMEKKSQPKLCVVYNRQRDSWNWLYHEGRKRRGKKLGTLAQLPTREAAIGKAEQMARRDNKKMLTIAELVEGYRQDRMPDNFSTRQTKESWIKNYILPVWGENIITDLEAYEIECWLKSLPLSGHSKRYLQSIVSCLWDYAMLRRIIPQTNQNPMRLVKIPGAWENQKEVWDLQLEEFHRFRKLLEEPFRTLVLVQTAWGLRISEVRGLKWKDVDWLGGNLRIERGMIGRHQSDLKTNESKKDLGLSKAVIPALKNWRQLGTHTGPEDWIFASSRLGGKYPWSYSTIYTRYQQAAHQLGIKRLGTHALRHAHRSLMIRIGTPQEVTREAMRHESDEIDREYGRVAPVLVRKAQQKVARLLISDDTGTR